MNENKSSKEQRRLFPNETQSKIGLAQTKGGYDIKIYLLFLIGILFFSISMNISMKSKGQKTKDIIFYFDYSNKIEDTTRQCLNSERNCFRINKYEEHDFILNTLIYLDSSKEIFTSKSFHPYQIGYYLYFLSCYENVLLYKDSSKINCNHNLLNEFSNTNKTKNKINLEKYKEKKLISSFRTNFYETILDKELRNLFFSVDNCNERREEKRREKIVTRGGAPKQKWIQKKLYFMK